MARASASAPCGLWAASTMIVGLRRTTSSRPGDVAVANPARTRSASSGPTPPSSASTAARARTALCAWCSPNSGRNTSSYWAFSPFRLSTWPPTASPRPTTPNSRPSRATTASTSTARSRIASAATELLLGDDRDGARLDDARLLAGDAGDRVAEVVAVVEPDRGDDRDDAVGDVGRVPAAAEADLDDRDVDGGVREGRERQRRQHLEVRERHAAVGRRVGVDDGHVGLDLLPRREQALGGDRLPVEADALAGVGEVRRREQAGAQAERPQQRLDHACRRALAVRAGDVDDGIRRLRAAEQVGECRDPREGRLDPVLRPARLEARPELGQAADQSSLWRV